VARIAGRNARLYVAVTSGGSAEPIPFLKSFSIKSATDRYEVTSFGDSGKAYVAGLPDAQGDWAGMFDNATAQLYTSSQDGVARKAYMYPDITAAGTYWYTTAFFDFNCDVAVDGPVTISGTWAAASALTKVG
jgi:hypothetical protein